MTRNVVKPGTKVRLSEWDPSDTDGLSEGPETQAKMARDLEELSDLQELLAAAQTHAVLVVLQGIDTAGKDGTIKHVFSGVNPQGCRVASFKVPTEVEKAHDYLWRIHRECPGKGEIVVFNRSHYESVLVERVHGLVPKDVWKKRYREIEEFERVLRRSGTIILKFFLNLGSEEQKERLLAREKDPKKAWKSNPGDWAERRLWDAYQEAYEEMLRKTSTRGAPWIVVPSNHKWYRNLVVAAALVDALKEHRPEWEAAIVERGRKALEAARRPPERRAAAAKIRRK
jgi:PPK2 family polyphosphate:nucleotide phosphotransferase